MKTLIVYHWSHHDTSHSSAVGGSVGLNTLVVFTHPDVLRPEQELSVQVGLFYQVHVGHGDLPPLSCPQADEGKVFKQLAADGTGSNLKTHGFKSECFLYFGLQTQTTGNQVKGHRTSDSQTVI